MSERSAERKQRQHFDYLTLAQAARLVVPQLGTKPVAPSTLWRWAVKGIGGVRLQHLRIGRRCVVRPEWLTEFFAQLAQTEPRPREAPKPAVPRQRTAKQRQRDIERAEQRMGVSA